MPRYETCDCSYRPTHPKRICAFCGNLTMSQIEHGYLYRFIATLRGDEKAVWWDWAEGLGLVKRSEAT